MPSRVDVFWSFRRPYSYLATSRLTAHVGPTERKDHQPPEKASLLYAL